MNEKSRFTGSIVGSALGDAIGQMAFVYDDINRLIRATQEAKTLTYTDDTAMAIGIMESILAKGGIDPQHLGDTFMKNYQKEPWRGYASGPPVVFETAKNTE